MYTVYGSPLNRAFRVMWMLEELGQPYELKDAAPRSDEVVARNPSGKVPVLEDGDEAITDSVAIVTYLADKHSALTAPAGTLARARQDGATQFVVDEIEGALWCAAKHSFVLPEELRVREVKDACRYDFVNGIERLAARLGDKPYLNGDGFTISDLLAGHCADWARSAKFDLPNAGPVAAYFARIRERPAYKKTAAQREAARSA